MGRASNNLTRRKAARSKLGELYLYSDEFYVIHYSCESFYDNADGNSRRIASIAVLNVGSGQSASFSIHQVSEQRGKKVSLEDIKTHYDDLERSMLDDFYRFIGSRSNARWLHWNMRDANFGFEALAHRHRVLGGSPVDIPTSHLYDLAGSLISIYGRDYVKHGGQGRLTSLMHLNSVSGRDFLSGKQEADAFEKREFVMLHQSTLRKVRVIQSLASLEWDGILRVELTWWQRHGGSLAGLVDSVTDLWLYKLAGGIAMVGGLIVLGMTVL